MLGAVAVVLVEWMRQHRRWDTTRREAYASVLVDAARVRKDVIQATLMKTRPDVQLFTSFRESVENADLLVDRTKTSLALRDFFGLLDEAYTDCCVLYDDKTGIRLSGVINLHDEDIWAEKRGRFSKAARAELGLKGATAN